jgi:hypothetical protein
VHHHHPASAIGAWISGLDGCASDVIGLWVRQDCVGHGIQQGRRKRRRLPRRNRRWLRQTKTGRRSLPCPLSGLQSRASRWALLQHRSQWRGHRMPQAASPATTVVHSTAWLCALCFAVGLALRCTCNTLTTPQQPSWVSWAHVKACVCMHACVNAATLACTPHIATQHPCASAGHMPCSVAPCRHCGHAFSDY